jgi:hypothetical protein
MGGMTLTQTGGGLSTVMRASAVLLFLLLSFLSAAPVLAGGPVSREGTVPTESVEPAGVVGCDVRMSVEDGPLVDGTFSVRVWQPFIVWGFGYPPDTEINLEFHGGGVATFTTMSDSAGEFAEGFYAGPDTQSGYLVAWVTGGCDDTISITVLPPHPFDDVDGFEYEIAWLYREGITGGCTAARFCPNDPVTRGQMAAFLNRALELPSTTTDFFDDDDGTTFETDINRLAAAGITGGCDTRRFCQNANVTREQMASFLARAFGLPGSSTDFFTDDNTSIHEGQINALAASGITGGCAAGRYCPKSNVTREQMAAFLYRAFN